MNIVLVILDTLRQDHLGAYGNEWIKTPHWDAFAQEAVRFTRAYSESLPTVPVRRTLHTGRRVYPFRDHREYKGAGGGILGWAPIPQEQDTVAEVLSSRGYRCALITDTYHQFKPSMNFHRGFDEWVWVRGQEGDSYRTGPAVPAERMGRHRYGPPGTQGGMANYLTNHLRNNSQRSDEADYFAARLFGEASRWVTDNRDAERFFLVVDSFDPHEPWDPPAWYRELYDPDDDVADVIGTLHGTWRDKITSRQLKRLQANYAGEVTMADRWFGHLVETLRLTGRLEDTVVVVISDHGHNLGWDPGDKGMVGKQGHPSTRAVNDLVLMIRHPSGEGAGGVCDKLIYNHDVIATLLSLIGDEMSGTVDGLDVWPAIDPSAPAVRDHVTSAWGPLVTVITDEWWFNASLWGEGKLLYKVREDARLERNLSEDFPDICEELLGLAIDDAGGQIPEFLDDYRGRTWCVPFEDLAGWVWSQYGSRSG